MEKVQIDLEGSTAYGQSIKTIRVRTDYVFSATRLRNLVQTRAGRKVYVKKTTSMLAVGAEYDFSFIPVSFNEDGPLVDLSEQRVLEAIREIEEQIEAGRMIQEALDAIDKS